MKYSIIVPIYNTEKYLRACIDSILAQTFNDFELLLIDDGSSDSSGQIADEYACTNNNIKVLHKHNEGLVSSRKAGAMLAKGKYVVNIDSDDIIDNDFLCSVDNAICSNNYPDIIAIGHKRIDNCDNVIGTPYKSLLPSKLYEDKLLTYIIDNYLYSDTIKGLNLGLLPFSVCTKVIERDIYVRNQLKIDNGITIGEDLLLTYYLLKDIKSLYVLDYCGYGYRMSDSSMMVHLTIKSISEYEKTVNVLSGLYENDLNKVCVYSEVAIYNCLSSFAKTAITYGDFKDKLKESRTYSLLWNFAKKAKIKKGLKDIIKNFIVKHEIGIVLYILNKNR